MMILESHAAVEIDRAISVIHFQVYDCRTELPGLVKEKFKGLLSDSKASVFRPNEKFVDPGVAPSVLQAVIETHDNISDTLSGHRDEPHPAEFRLPKQLFDDVRRLRLVERTRPGIVGLQLLHHANQSGNILGNCCAIGDCHERKGVHALWQELGANYLFRTAARLRVACTAPAPVPRGGLRAPSSSSLSTTALLSVAFFDANRSVSRFFA